MNMHIWPDKPDRVSSAHFKRPHNIENLWYMAILPFWGKLIIVKVRCHELYAIIKFPDLYLLHVNLIMGV